MTSRIDDILDKVLGGGGEVLDEGQALFLYDNAPLEKLMMVANEIRLRLHPNDVVTWQIDRNVNLTNVCVSGCKFCNFHCKVHQTDLSYITTEEEYRSKIEELLALGGDQILLQGGMHPKLGVEYYCDLFAWLKKEFPTVKLNALGPPEVVHIANISGLTTIQVLEKLIASGLDSLPGAGAEILDNEIRKRISPGKCSADLWLDVMEQAHRLGLLGSATMMYGHVEENSHRIAHLFKIRELQRRTSGFLAFIPWPYQGCGTRLEAEGVASHADNTIEYLRLVAISRLVLYNVPNIQASWLTVGVQAGSMALHAGANDMGSIMIEENVVSAAGSNNSLDRQSMQQTIRRAGFTPALRNQRYELR